MAIETRLLGGRYRLVEVIGEGGMAVVHRGRDELLDREVAIKVLREQFAADPDFVSRFRREARNAAALGHPNIAPVFDTGVDGGVEYIVMQLVDGPDLERVLAERGRLPVAEALRIGVAAADALAAAHRQGIVHRDIKPGNILLDRDGEVRVVDFGIARALGDARTTNPGLMLASVQYCSPEQVLGQPVGPASDVFSLGAVLYELVTGRRPWEGDAPAAVALARTREVPPPPSAVVGDVPDGIDALVMRALAVRPQDRYASAEALTEAIRAWWRGYRAQQQAADPRRAAAAARRRAGHTAPMALPAAVAGAAAGAGADDESGGASPTRSMGAGVAAAGTVAPADANRRAPWARGDGRRRRRAAVPPWLLPAALALGLVAVALAALNPFARSGGVGSSTASPGATVAAIASSPTGSAPATPSASPTVAPTPAVAPTPTIAPTPPPTPPPTPRSTPPPSPPPTPPPTPQPTPPPAVVVTPPPAPPEAGPVQVVASFYAHIARGDFRAAEGLWTEDMRRRYPPDSNIDGRFSETTAFELNRNELVAQDGESAVVAVDLVEYQSDEVRRYVGNWNLVLTGVGWRLNEPDLSQRQ